MAQLENTSSPKEGGVDDLHVTLVRLEHASNALAYIENSRMRIYIEHDARAEPFRRSLSSLVLVLRGFIVKNDLLRFFPKAYSVKFLSVLRLVLKVVKQLLGTV